MGCKRMTAWQSLYLPSGVDAAATLKDALLALGYTPFDPFGLMPSKTFPQAVRLFVAPSQGGWTRVIGAPEPETLPQLSRIAPCLLVELDGADARIEAYAEGEAAAPQIAFMTYAHEHDCIHRALAGDVSTASNPAVGGVSLGALPADVQALAGSVNPQQAESLFARISGTLAKKGGTDEAAADLLRQPDWNSVGGSRIAALMECLRIPGWRTPDFVTLRDAYALHKRRQRAPNAKLYPGDAEALAAVPDALAYTPVYMGKP